MRSSNGMGTITKRKGVTKPYLVYGTAVKVDGVTKRPYLGAFKTRKEAEQRRIEYYQNPNIKRSELTFKQVFEEYQKSMKYTKLSKSSQDNYKAAYKHCEKLYGISFCNLRTGQMQEILNDMEAKNMSKSSVKKVSTLFSLLYRYAIENDIVNKNYAEFVILPDIEEKEKRIFTDIEIKKITDAAKKGNKAAMWTYYLMCSGWRISEMLELTRFTYDAENHYFRGGLKTAAGKNRIVPVHSCVQWIIDEQLSKNGDTIFCMDSGKPMTSHYFREFLFDPMLEELGLDESLTPHIARHTFSTKLKINGADDFYRKRLLGHASGNVTDDVYTHADVESLRNTIELLKIA